MSASKGGSDRTDTNLGALLRLSGPLVAAYGGHQLLSFVDTAMVGRFGAADLAGVGIGGGIYFTITSLGVGCVMGMDAFVAQAVGAGEMDRARRVLRQGLRVALFVGLPLTLLAALSTLLLGPAGVDPVAAERSALYIFGRLPSVLPFLLFIAFRGYLQALGVTRPIVVATGIANVVNVLADGLLIFGDAGLVRVGLPPIGLPALGALGAGVASSLVTIVTAVVLWLSVRSLRRKRSEVQATVNRSSEPQQLQDASQDPSMDASMMRGILRLGVPVGLQMVAEVGIFSLVGVLAGVLGAQAAAANQVALQLAAFTFTVSLGISSATSVLVGRAVGRDDHAGARQAGMLGLLVACGFMSFAALLFLVVPNQLARILTNDTHVIAAALPLLTIAAFFQISDGIQVVSAGALRGAGDTEATLWANLAGHYGIGLPVMLALAFGYALGGVGLWWGLLGGLTGVAVVLTVRFWRLTSRPIARV